MAKEKIDTIEVLEALKNTDEKDKAKPTKQELFRDKFFFAAFISVWAVIIFWNLFSPKVAGFSEAENRVLPEFPTFNVDSLLDGDYMDGIESYLNDHFVGKSMWISGKSTLEYGLGKREMNDIIFGDGVLLVDIQPPNYSIVNANVDGINVVAEKTGLPTYVMIVPSATSVQADKLPTFGATMFDEKQFLDDVYEGFSDSVVTIDAYATLLAHKEEYIYYRTDHHWTSYGAFLAYQELCGAMGMSPPQESDFQVSTLSSNFLGTSHTKTWFPFVEADEMMLYQNGSAKEYTMQDALLGENIKYEIFENTFFEEFLATKDQYSYFTGRVTPKATITTNSTSGKKLLLFKDSYAHCMVPMMFEEYSEICMVDLRYAEALDYETYREVLGIDDYDEIMFLYSADTFAHSAQTSKFA